MIDIWKREFKLHRKGLCDAGVLIFHFEMLNVSSMVLPFLKSPFIDSFIELR